MLFPAFRDIFNDDPFELTEKEPLNSLKCDIKEYDDHYGITFDMPGFNKEDIKIQLNDGHLSVRAERHENKEEKDKKGHVIRQERMSGSYARSFFVGDNVRQEDIKAEYRNGVLSVTVPKTEEKKTDAKKYIEIK